MLFSKVWTTEKAPSSCRKSVVVPIFKKGPRSDCANHRGISLIPVVPKLLASTLLRRISKTREELTREEQAAFRAGRGCMDQIFTLRQLLEHRNAYQRPTIVVFLDIRAAFDSVDRSALWNCLSRNGVPAKYISILKALYQRTSGRVRAYGQLSPPFVVSSGVRQGCPISPFLFNFAIDDVLRNTFSGLTSCGIELLPGNRVTDLEYADDIALLGESAQAMQTVLNRMAIEVSQFGMCFAPSKCKVLLQDWQEPVPVITLNGDRLNVVDNFVYLGSNIAAGGGVGDEISSRIAKARLAFANLRHLWRRRDIRLSLKGRVYKATVRSVLLYGCETWPLRAEDARRLSVFDHRCLRSIARIRWQHRVSNDEVRRRVLGIDSRPLTEVITAHRLRWLGHVLRMPAHRLPYRSLFATPGHGWKKRRGGQSMTWRRGMKKLSAALASVGPSRLPGWGTRDPECRWLETLRDMAQNRSQWRECCSAVQTNARDP
ncbi:reverse transcriptase domain-containing protein [Streptococcus dysgalactiae]|uniref:reverse transcriptase domain-containing protein n=1 Tax=Streptococcus dysgalactiae TaxID=1334 RepID=UPI003D7AAF16